MMCTHTCTHFMWRHQHVQRSRSSPLGEHPQAWLKLQQKADSLGRGCPQHTGDPEAAAHSHPVAGVGEAVLSAARTPTPRTLPGGTRTETEASREQRTWVASVPGLRGTWLLVEPCPDSPSAPSHRKIGTETGLLQAGSILLTLYSPPTPIPQEA